MFPSPRLRIIVCLILVINLNIVKINATKYLDVFTTSPGPLEYDMTVKWDQTNFSNVDTNQFFLTLYNISGAWKNHTVAYNSKQFTVSGLTVNQEYWFEGKYYINGTKFTQQSTKMWGQSFPSAPTKVNSTYLDRTLTLTYDKPTMDGGSDFKSYVLRINNTDNNGNVNVIYKELPISSTKYEIEIKHGDNVVYEIAAKNDMGNSTFAAFPKSKNSVVRFVINGTTTNTSVYPTSVLEHIQTFLDTKLSENYNNKNRRRRRLLADSTFKRYVKVEEEEPVLFYAPTKTSFTHNLRVSRLFESEMAFISTQIETTTFLDNLKSLSGKTFDVMFAAASDNYVYAYDIGNKNRRDGVILRFPYEMCDIKDRLGFSSPSQPNNYSMPPCGCPGYAHLPAKPILAAPVLVEDSTRSILLIATFNTITSSTLTAVNVRGMLENKLNYKYSPKLCHIPNSGYVAPTGGNSVKKLWIFSTEDGQPLSHSPVWFENTVLIREGMYLVALDITNGQRLWTFSINCRGANDNNVPKLFKGATFVQVEYDTNCDHVDISNRSDARPQLENVSYILDVYLPVDKNNKVLSRSNDNKAVYVRSSRGTLYAVDITNGTLLFSFNVGPRLYSHPIHDIEDTTHLDKYWVSSNSGTLYHLTCPKDAHIVLNRIVYVCPELTIVKPTQEDLCNDLDRPCVKVQKLRQLLDKGEWVKHKNTINLL
eukprot:g4212.t1